MKSRTKVGWAPPFLVIFVNLVILETLEWVFLAGSLFIRKTLKYIEYVEKFVIWVLLHQKYHEAGVIDILSVLEWTSLTIPIVFITTNRR